MAEGSSWNLKVIVNNLYTWSTSCTDRKPPDCTPSCPHNPTEGSLQTIREKLHRLLDPLVKQGCCYVHPCCCEAKWDKGVTAGQALTQAPGTQQAFSKGLSIHAIKKRIEFGVLTLGSALPTWKSWMVSNLLKMKEWWGRQETRAQETRNVCRIRTKRKKRKM